MEYAFRAYGVFKRFNIALELCVPEDEDFLKPRRCLLPPLPEHEAAAKMLSEAADAILADDLVLARNLVQRADMPVLFEHAFRVISDKDPRIQRGRPVQVPVGKVARTTARMPSVEAQKALFIRDDGIAASAAAACSRPRLDPP